MYQIVAEEAFNDNDPGGIVPGFLNKLWKLVDDEDTDDMIGWSEDGMSFQVSQPNMMAKELLPYYFKHNNLSSFIRQLNMYGFKKLTTIDGGGLKGDRDEMIFQHPFFVKGNGHLLPLIKRKVSLKKGASSALVEPSGQPKKYTDILQEVNAMKYKQAQMNSKLLSMRRDNEELWEEVTDLRKKHNNQQAIVQRLIQFLLTIARNQRPFGSHVKRKPQLAISGLDQEPKNKVPKYSRELSKSDALACAGMDSLEEYDLVLGNPGASRITDITDNVGARKRATPSAPAVEGTSYTVESPKSFPPSD